jgi:CubicO group peptidase (beta-lactamase class C family)
MQRTVMTRLGLASLPAVGLFFASLAAAAQDLPTAKPEAVGLSSERLDRITAKVQQTIDDKRIAGAVTLVARHGKIAYFKSQGSLDRALWNRIAISLRAVPGHYRAAAKSSAAS